jgi:hypothetical protein
MNCPRLVSVCVVSLVFILPPFLMAQTNAGSPDALPTTSAASPSPDDLQKAIAEKQAEIEQLKEQLSAAQGQIKTLHEQNSTLQKSDDALKTEVQASPVVVAQRPAPLPLSATPDTSAPIDSSDLFWYFHNSPESANQYLAGKNIAVTGKLVGFDPPMLRRVFSVHLETGDPNLRVVCKFDIPPAYNSVIYRRQQGAILGVAPGGREDQLLSMNSAITIKGKCDGSDGGDVGLSRCVLVLQ